MGGPDAVRGIGYQQAQAVAEALAVFDDEHAGAVRVEGVHDVIDIETLTVGGDVLRAQQVKARSDEYTWGKSELIAVLRRWAALPLAGTAQFEFRTDGRLGPTGEQVQAALEQAQAGDLAALAALLDEDASERVCQRLRRARLLTDPVSTGALLLRAERQVAAMLPSARTADDLRELSKAAVDRLFRLLMERAGHPDPAVRTVDRQEIADVLGIPRDYRLTLRWPGQLRQRYVQAAGLPVDCVTPPGLLSLDAYRRTDVNQHRQIDDVTAVLATPTSLLTGRTGTGKTTACRVLVRDAATTDRVVLLAHAEAYLPGRIEALAADALSAVIGEDVSTGTGRQVLADPSVTFVIDGVSEVPEAVQEALAEDLRVPVAAQRGSGLVLVGRDIAALRSVLPSTSRPAAFEVAPLEREHRQGLARMAISGTSSISTADLDHRARTLVAQIEHALGEAAGNPLMFQMAAELIARGISFQDRADLYEGFLGHLAERTGTADILAVGTVLGVVFARLLNEERRYADPYEWIALINQALTTVTDLDFEPSTVDAAARRSGIVTTLGYVQTVVPIHDSMADYLAAVAHAKDAIELPRRLRPSDEQRLAFYAEINGVDAKSAALVVRDLPFLTVALARRDQRALSADTPREVAALLEVLVSEPTAVGLWRQDGRVMAMRLDGGPSRWLSDDEARILITRLRASTAIGGPLAIAVRLWRQKLMQGLETTRTLGPPRPSSLMEACEQLSVHAAHEKAALQELVSEIVPQGTRAQVLAALGPLGLRARVGAEELGVWKADWPVSYGRAEDIDVVPAQAGAPDATLTGHSSLGSLVSDSPEECAAKRLADTINHLVGANWL